MKYFSIMGVYWKIRFLEGGGCMKNQYIGGKMSKKGGLAGAKLGGQVGRPPMHFFENKKKVPWFWKKCPNCVHFCESSVQNAVLIKSI